MKSLTKKIYSAVKLPQEAVDMIKDAGFELEMHGELTTPSSKEIIEKSKQAQAIISGVNVQITADIIEASPQLEIIANVGAGVNNIDFEAAKQHQVVLTNTPSRDSVASTAELALGLVLALSRNILQTQEMVQANDFPGWQVMGFLGGHQVAYKKLLIVGFGNIGQEIARMAKAFHMDLYYYDIKDRSNFAAAEKETGAQYIDFEQGLSLADYVILQMNYTPDNHHFIGEEELKLMKEDAFLINTARGGIVDEAALVKALKQGWIAGAGIDVHEEEPKINQDLLATQKVVMTPHIGNDTYEARTEMAKIAATEAVKGLKGQTLTYQVD